ncbi:hypothetical protein E2542_SST09516 [Spatholobus suberectus]|nr:hypothetical protein E2542_SST09516 [Spatholobus suberectus]
MESGMSSADKDLNDDGMRSNNDDKEGSQPNIESNDTRSPLWVTFDGSKDDLVKKIMREELAASFLRFAEILSLLVFP